MLQSDTLCFCSLFRSWLSSKSQDKNLCFIQYIDFSPLCTFIESIHSHYPPNSPFNWVQIASYVWTLSLILKHIRFLIQSQKNHLWWKLLGIKVGNILTWRILRIYLGDATNIKFPNKKSYAVYHLWTLCPWSFVLSHLIFLIILPWSSLPMGTVVINNG